jgi:hypothetical protein
MLKKSKFLKRIAPLSYKKTQIFIFWGEIWISPKIIFFLDFKFGGFIMK